MTPPSSTTMPPAAPVTDTAAPMYGSGAVDVEPAIEPETVPVGAGWLYANVVPLPCGTDTLLPVGATFGTAEVLLCGVDVVMLTVMAAEQVPVGAEIASDVSALLPGASWQ